MKNKALLIIDMQKGSFVPNMPRFNAHEIISNINQISAHFREAGYPVIHLQHDGSAQNHFLPNTNEWEIIDEIQVEADDLRISKNINNCFYKSKLLETLKKLLVNELYITGCATDFCVNATVIGALDHDFKLSIVRDGHTTTDRPHANAKQLIDHYNYIWENMTPTNGEMSVLKASEIKGLVTRSIGN